MGLTKADIAILPKSPMGNETKEKFAEYVQLVMDRVPKTQILRNIFPERYDRAVSRASGKQSVVDANIRKELNQIERSKYVLSLFDAADKTWWIQFLDKKQDLYEGLFNIAKDKDEQTKDRISASKTLLHYMPSAVKEQKVEHTHKLENEESFKDRLSAMKKELHETANKTITIDVDIIDCLDKEDT